MKNITIWILMVSWTLSFIPLLLKAQSTEYNYATGNVKGRNYVGGLIGRIVDKEGRVTNSYARGNVSAETHLGGFAGSNNGMIENSYSTGKVTGNTNKGGFVGTGTGSAIECYWDKQTSGIAESDGGLGKNTTAMTHPYAAGTYTNWDFNSIWSADVTPEQNNGYPLLRPSSVYRLDLRVVPPGAGTVSGAGFYKSGQSVMVNAKSSELFVFKAWMNGTDIISAKAQDNLSLINSTTLIARFENKNTANKNDLIPDKRNLVLYPNPVDNILWVDASTFFGKAKSFSIINMIGQVVKIFKTNSELDGRISFSVADLMPGMYFLKADFEQELVLEKFIKN